jgi:hypothetical protein
MIEKWMSLLLFQVLHPAIVRRDHVDRLWWVSSKKGLFKVKSFSSSLACSEGKFLTVDNLKKRHIIIVDRCCLLQERWGIGGPPYSSLRCGFRSVEYHFYSFWYVLSYT